MTRVTDNQILTLKTKIDNGNVTVTQGCKDLRIAPVTYYRRLDKLTKQSDKVQEIVNNVTNELPLTIQTIQAELQAIISDLKGMKGKDTREQLSIMDRKIAALDKMNNTLKTTQILIDNRSVNIEVKTAAQREVCAWVYDRVHERGGKEIADKVLGWLSEAE